jgi:SAM-dependent methyltransferase
MGFQLSEIKLLGLPRHRQMLLSRMKMKVLTNIPENIKKRIFYGRKCYCPVCESPIREYEQFGHIAKLWCPVCTSMRWQRFAWLFLKDCTNLFDGTSKKMLHIAPEIAFEPRLKQVPNLDYLTGDLLDPKVMLKVDVTNIPFPDGAFDVIFCSHVMEHVPDDRKALHEFVRVLSANGWVIFLVPIRMNQRTDEDLTVTDPREREKRFGQQDHVRYYGWDFEERLEEAGFQVDVVRASDMVEDTQFEEMGIDRKEVLFYCRKKQL